MEEKKKKKQEEKTDAAQKKVSENLWRCATPCLAWLDDLNLEKDDLGVTLVLTMYVIKKNSPTISLPAESCCYHSDV